MVLFLNSRFENMLQKCEWQKWTDQVCRRIEFYCIATDTILKYLISLCLQTRQTWQSRFVTSWTRLKMIRKFAHWGPRSWTKYSENCLTKRSLNFGIKNINRKICLRNPECRPLNPEGSTEHFSNTSLRRAIKRILLERSLFSFKRGWSMSLLWRCEKSGPRNRLRSIVHV
jgi:hypothetical protein